MTTLGIIGVGSIASSIVTGLSDGDTVPIILSPRSEARSADLAARYPGVTVAPTNQAVVDGSDVVLLAVLPQHAQDVLAPLTFRADQAVVSVIAGVDLSTLGELVAPARDIARGVPAPAVATAASVTPIHPATPAARELFDRLGGHMPIDDELALESVSAASATVEAYFHYLGAVADWLASRGVAAGDARRYVAATFRELAPEMDTPEVDFGALARAHTSEGGLNEQFARHLAANGTFDAVGTGLDAVLDRIAPGSSQARLEHHGAA